MKRLHVITPVTVFGLVLGSITPIIMVTPFFILALTTGFTGLRHTHSGSRFTVISFNHIIPLVFRETQSTVNKEPHDCNAFLFLLAQLQVRLQTSSLDTL